MQKTKIEWLHWLDGRPGYSWNPIKGLCPQGCWYCYARVIYRRFGENIMSNYENDEGGSTLNLEDTFLFDPQEEKFPKRSSRIFVCSTFELFHSAVRPGWRDAIFQVIKSHPQHTFFILTKRPENIDRDMPKNVWLGVSITGSEEDEYRAAALRANAWNCKNRFISFEPLFFMPDELSDLLVGIKWVIIGRLTGHGNHWRPDSILIKAISDRAKLFNIPVFLKNNLKHPFSAPIWPGKLIQQFPVVKG